MRRRPSQRPATQTWLRRPELLAGAAIAGLLTLLAVISVPTRAAASSVLSFREMASAARLFHRALPTILLLPIDPFALLVWGSVALLWMIYLSLVWRLRARPVSVPLVAGGAVGFGLLALVIPPVFSTDIFSYAMFGRLAGVYHVNPYLTTPARIAASDPLMPFVFWRDIPSPYGPLWTLLSAGVALGRHALPIALVLRFKLVALAATLLDGWLIYRFVRRAGAERAGWAYLAFAWNPLVLIDGPVSGHNDVLILACVLVGAWLVQTHPKFGLACLAASALIKYSTVPMLGASLVRLVRRAPGSLRPAFVVRVAALGLLVVVAAFLPFWHGPATLTSTLNEPGRGVNNPLTEFANWAVAGLTRGRLHVASSAATVGLAVVLFGAWQVVQLVREDKRAAAWTVEDELASWAQTLTVFLMVWPRVHTWYWLLPLGLALAAGPRHRRLAIVVVLTSILAYASWFG